MASTNADSVAQQGEFHARRPGTEPMTTKGHAPGTLVGNDAYPEFSAETHPPGTAPRQDTYKPNPESQLPASSSMLPDASSTLVGATSADVHTGLGHPGQGQTSSEMHDRSGERSGLEGVGASATDPTRERRFDVGVEPDSRGKTKNAGDFPGAEDAVPQSAESVASERK